MDHAVTSSCSIEVCGGTSDFTSEFTATEKFKSKEDLISWAKRIGSLHDFTVVVLRSDSKKPRVTLGCERSGKCDSRSSSKYGSKKCDCPFRLTGKKVAAGDEWELKVVEGMHNHEAGHPGKGHSFQGTLSQADKSLLEDRCKTGDQPKEILSTLKQRDEHNKSTDRTIYNGCQSWKRRQRLLEENSRLRQLMSKAEENNFIEKHRTNPEKDTVLDFFLTHPTSLELLLAFPTILMIMLTNRNDSMAVTLDIFGNTSTSVDFYVGMAILSSKRKTSYEWALTSLRGLMDDYGIAMPDTVIVETKGEEKIEGDLIRAIKDVFSTAKLLLSTFSIEDKALYYCQKKSKLNDEELSSFSEMWKLLVVSLTEADLEQYVKQLHAEFYMYRGAVDYVIDTLLKPYKEMFVAAWTDKVMHFGNIDWRIRSELTDYLMSKYQGKCKDSAVVEQTVIDEHWEYMHGYIQKEHARVKASIAHSLNYEYNDRYGISSELKELYGAISILALCIVNREVMRSQWPGNDDHDEYCGCYIRRTYSLPCAHEIAKYRRQGRPVPLECFHSYWRKLDLKPVRKTRDLNVEGRMKRRKLSEPNSSRASPSVVPSKQEKQPEDSKVSRDIQPTLQREFEDVFPPALRSYIDTVKDVPRDGHCGFRAIASFVGYSEDTGWKRVRKDLTDELLVNSFHYAQIFGSDQRVNELHDALTYYEGICLQKKHWMTMPDMGHIIASCYNVVFMHLSSVQCFTFFPLKVAPISISMRIPKEIVIGLVGDHFVQVYLKEDHPMPPPIPAPGKKKPHVATMWERFHQQRSTDWATPYLSRIEHFKSLQSKVVSQQNPSLLQNYPLSTEDIDALYDSSESEAAKLRARLFPNL